MLDPHHSPSGLFAGEVQADRDITHGAWTVRIDGEIVGPCQHGHFASLGRINHAPWDKRRPPWRYHIRGIHTIRTEPYFMTREEAAAVALAQCEELFGDQKDAA